jgi:hypothetical protein
MIRVLWMSWVFLEHASVSQLSQMMCLGADNPGLKVVGDEVERGNCSGVCMGVVGEVNNVDLSHIYVPS